MQDHQSSMSLRGTESAPEGSGALCAPLRKEYEAHDNIGVVVVVVVISFIIVSLQA